MQHVTVLARNRRSSNQRPTAASSAQAPDSRSRPASHAHVRPDLTVRAVDQLVDLRGEHRLHRRPLTLHDRHPPGLLTLAHPVRDRLVITPDQARRRAERARQVIRLQESPSQPPAFFICPPPDRVLMVKTRGITGRSGQNRWGDSWPPVGRISGRPRGVPVAAYGENLMATHIVERCERLTLGRVSCISAVAGCSFHCRPAQRRKR